MAQIELDTQLYERLKKVAETRAYPVTVEAELARAVVFYLDKWEPFMVLGSAARSPP